MGAWGSPQRPKAEQPGPLSVPSTQVPPHPNPGACGQLCVPRPPGERSLTLATVRRVLLSSSISSSLSQTLWKSLCVQSSNRSRGTRGTSPCGQRDPPVLGPMQSDHGHPAWPSPQRMAWRGRARGRKGGDADACSHTHGSPRLPGPPLLPCAGWLPPDHLLPRPGPASGSPISTCVSWLLSQPAPTSPDPTDHCTLGHCPSLASGVLGDGAGLALLSIGLVPQTLASDGRNGRRRRWPCWAEAGCAEGPWDPGRTRATRAGRPRF